ncbi:serine/threonine-protein kinase [Luteimonas sp. BDR2-5]|uniref:serine/threonine-protein kinase n=1 Tax=Proluteimonas luteida TaxID=2878685 RepID=UPI001E3D3FDC|nr:serine/threonine-protein kinase [Luteimonas sp. BDR2-5]MCD9027868.1 serine/threonine-protein kinase [Luteimonas sp. BDR2-5]
MSDATWKRLEALFHEATTQPPAEREAYAYAVAGDDPTLLRDLLAMIAADQDATRMLQAPLRGTAAPELAAGHRLGPWAIDRLVGAGGMGRVYLGHRADGAYERAVAIKLVASGLVDATRATLFELECRALARMRHPAIAEIHDAGRDTDGHHYLVMEYIDGLPITQWCDRQRLSLRDRVALFVQVCEGVQHAHQKGVLHRDLKPGNVLVGEVDGRAVPKLIDFGIAAEAAVQGDAVSAGTPGYASPEQTLGDGDADARSDVYSLGAMLYELACGCRAEPVAGAPPLAPSTVLDSRPAADRQVLSGLRGARPARLGRELRDGIDAIARKAMQPLRIERYDSVSALALDLQRWLGHRPPRAAAGDRWLATRKLLRRNRVATLAGSAMLLALVGGLVVALQGLAEAEAQRRQAEARQDELAAAVGFQQRMLDDLDPAIMGLRMVDDMRAHALAHGGPAAGTTFDRLTEGFDAPGIARGVVHSRILAPAEAALRAEFADQPVVEAALGMSIASLYFSQGLYAEAETLAERVATLRRRALGPGAEDTLRALDLQARAVERQARYDDALALIDRALADAGAGAAVDGLDALTATRGVVLTGQSRLDAAIALQSGLLDGMVRRRGTQDIEVLALRSQFAISLSMAGNDQAAHDQFAQVVAGRQALLGPEHPLTLAARGGLSNAVGGLGEHERMLAMDRELLDIRRRVQGHAHPDTLAALSNLASSLLSLDRDAEALEAARAAWQGRRQSLGPAHPQTLRSEQLMTNAMRRLGQVDAALVHQRSIHARRHEVLGPTHRDTLRSRFGLAATLHEAGLRGEARGHAEAMLALVDNGTPTPFDRKTVEALLADIGIR